MLPLSIDKAASLDRISIWLRISLKGRRWEGLKKEMEGS